MARPRLERFRWPILLLPGVLAYGVAGYMLVEGWSFLDALYMTILICAYGRVGRTAARELEAEGIPFVVIDGNEDLEEQMIEDGVRYMIGDPPQRTSSRRSASNGPGASFARSIPTPPTCTSP